MSRPLPKFTYEDYLLLPSEKRYELVEGEFIMVPSPSVAHQRVSGNLALFLRKFVLERGLGEIFEAPLDVVLSEIDVVQPDILFISKERSSILGEKAILGAPDLVIEIISPTTEKIDQVLKRKLYAKYGVKEYWIVDLQSKTIEVLILDKEGYSTTAIYAAGDTLTSPSLSGFSFSLPEIFDLPKVGKD